MSDEVRARKAKKSAAQDLARDEAFLALATKWKSASLLSYERLFALYSAAKWLAKDGKKGAIVECGCYRGGSMGLLLETLVTLGHTDREVYVFDTFNGFPEGTEDVRTDGVVLTRDSWVTENFRPVTEANIARAGYPMEKIHFVEGPVEETIPQHAPKSIAFLHLDTDYYESTLHELEHLYPRIQAKGVLIIDDYGAFEGCQRATDEYLATLKTPTFLQRIDYTGRLVIK